MQNKKRFFRTFYAIRMVTICILLTCSLAKTSYASTSIVFWTTEIEPSRQAVIKYLAQAFMIFNPDISISIRGVEENNIAKVLKQAIKSHESPDVISCASDLIISFCYNGWMNCPGTKLVINNIGKNIFFPGALNKLQLSNKEYCGIPFNGWVQGIWYRRDWFKKNGLDPPDSWENILKAAKTLHKPEIGQYGILIGTRSDAYAEQIFTHLALSAGVKEFSKNGEVTFDSPETVKTLKFYKELSSYSPPGPQWWRGRDYYLQGKLAMMFYSTFIMDDLAIPSIAANSLTGDNFNELTGAEYDYSLLKNTGMISSIKGTRKAGFGVVHALGLLKSGNRNKEAAAARFVNFLFRKDAYITWLHMVPGGMLPVLKGITEDDAFYRDAQGVFHKYSRQRAKAIVSGFDSLKSFSFTDGVLIPKAAHSSAECIIMNMVDEALNKNIPIKQAVSNAALKMKKISAAR